MLKANKELGIIFFPAFDWVISSTHPERQERLLYTQDQLREEGISISRELVSTSRTWRPSRTWSGFISVSRT